MSSRLSTRASTLCLLFAIASCGTAMDSDLELEVSIGPVQSELTQAIEYVGKTTTTDFRGTGMGQHLQYFPAFGLTSGQSGLRTDCSDCIELTTEFANFEHHIIFPLDKRTFSPDAGGNPLGVKTAGGYADWDLFTLPDGTTGRSGTTYDTSVCGNSNNFVNQIRINSNSLHEFCLNLITDNSNGDYDPDIRLEARSDDVDWSLEGHPDFTFDGQTDMYTFKYTGMDDNDRIKIRIKDTSGCAGAGLGGIMVSHIDTCTGPPCTPDCDGKECGDDGCGGTCAPGCSGNDTCDAGVCVCIPDCDGKDCGDDGCGGSCGTCSGDDTCEAGVCTPPSTGISVVSSALGLSHTAPGGSNRLLVFTAHGVDERDRYMQSVSYGGKAMSQAVALSKKGDGRYAIVSLWYLDEADIAAASGSSFSINWNSTPSDRNYTSVFLTGVNQGAPLGSITSGQCSSCTVRTCGAMTVESGHVELYGATSRNNGNYTALNGFTELQDATMGSKGEATSGYKAGSGASETGGVQHPQDRAQVIACIEVQN